jgi:hypothetical protein
LSQLGHRLMPHLNSLVEWTLENQSGIMASRKLYEAGKTH